MGLCEMTESSLMTDTVGKQNKTTIDVGVGEPLTVSSVSEAVSTSRQLQDAIERCMDEFENCEKRLPAVSHESEEAHDIRLEADLWVDKVEELLGIQQRLLDAFGLVADNDVESIGDINVGDDDAQVRHNYPQAYEAAKAIGWSLVGVYNDERHWLEGRCVPPAWKIPTRFDVRNVQGMCMRYGTVSMWCDYSVRGTILYYGCGDELDWIERTTRKMGNLSKLRHYEPEEYTGHAGNHRHIDTSIPSDDGVAPWMA